MPTWPIHVQDWQHECCGEPFGVGDRVRWTLVLTEESDDGWGWPAEMVVELRVVGRRLAESEEEAAVEVISTLDGPEVAVDPSVADNDVTVRGSLIEEHHGGVPADIRPAEGVVRGLKVVSQRFRLAGRTLTAIPGAVRLRAVDRMPDAFTHPDADETSREQWLEIGALAELALD